AVWILPLGINRGNGRTRKPRRAATNAASLPYERMLATRLSAVRGRRVSADRGAIYAQRGSDRYTSGTLTLRPWASSIFACWPSTAIPRPLRRRNQLVLKQTELSTANGE